MFDLAVCAETVFLDPPVALAPDRGGVLVDDRLRHRDPTRFRQAFTLRDQQGHPSLG
jgi:hypothetical protein